MTPKKKKEKPSRSLFKRIKMTMTLSLLGGLAILIALSAFWFSLPSVRRLKWDYPTPISQGRGKSPKIQWTKSVPRNWVRLRDISKVAIWAVIVSEDWAFYQHEGLDLEQMKESIETNLKRGRLARGGSTISQQVVKNAFLTREKTFSRKFKEVILTLWMEQVVGKSRILETYFNLVEWGEGIYGIKAAAQTYFGKNPSDLSAAEGAYLAMLLPSPVRYSQSFRKGDRELSDFATHRVNAILSRLTQAGLLTPETLNLEKEKWIQLNVR